MRLWLIDFDTASCTEEGLYILRSEDKPTEEQCLEALYGRLYAGAIYFDSVQEITKQEFRSKQVTLMDIKDRDA